MSEKETRFTLDEDELETIEIIARNKQSGRITPLEVRELVRVYREHMKMETAASDLYEALIFAKAQLEAYERAATGETYNSPLINVALSKAIGETP